MKNDVLQLMFGSLALVLGAGCEELLPKVFGVGFPILLMIVVFLSVRFGLLLTVFLAIAAGAMEDAVSSLTPMTSVSAFLIVAVLVRRFGLPYLAAMLVFPCYQLWLSVWMGGLNVFTRILVAIPLGSLTAVVVSVVLVRAIGKAAIHELE